MIKSFKDKETQKVFQNQYSRKLPTDIQHRAHDKLLLLDAAEEIGDLRTPPGNRLEVLRGRRAGQHSIRVNRQWRICFRWQNGHAYDVEITDYHS